MVGRRAPGCSVRRTKWQKSRGLFKGFQESILGSVIRGIGGSDDEETVASFAAIGEFEKFTDLLDGDKAGWFLIRRG